MQVRYEKQAVKALNKMPKKIATAFQEKIKTFALDPHKAHVDVKRLEGTKNSWRLRHGGWRAVLIMTPGTLIVEKIGARGDIYK